MEKSNFWPWNRNIEIRLFLFLPILWLAYFIANVHFTWCCSSPPHTSSNNWCVCLFVNMYVTLSLIILYTKPHFKLHNLLEAGKLCDQCVNQCANIRWMDRLNIFKPRFKPLDHNFSVWLQHEHQ